MKRPGPAAEWARLIRGAPLGVVILCALLFFLGAGLVFGGIYLAIARRDTGWVAWAMALGFGPTALYLALHLLRGTSWSWLTMVALLAMLLCSSLLRAFGPGDAIVSPLVEVAVEVACLAYLALPRIRRSFGWA